MSGGLVSETERGAFKNTPGGHRTAGSTPGTRGGPRSVRRVGGRPHQRGFGYACRGTCDGGPARSDARGNFSAAEKVRELLRQSVLDILLPTQGVSIDQLIAQGPRPFVILAVGVNGVGKTTTVAKLTQRFRQQGHTALLVAGDTFRAAAIDQLQVWADRIQVDIIRHRPGADPAAVAYDGITAAKARGSDVVLIDTAGRLHTKTNLMDELRKIKRIVAQECPGAPHEVLLVLDATVGQNAIAQARQFHEAVGVTGIALTKLDGTARGGIVVAIADTLKIPVRLIGVGESVEDLQDFNAKAFVDALF